MASPRLSWHMAIMIESTRIEKRVGVRADAERIWDLLADFSAWDRFNPYETGLDGRIGFGAPLRLIETLPELAARSVEATVSDWQPRAQLVWVEKRGWLFSAVRYFEIEELEPGACILANGLIVQGLRGELWLDRHAPRLRRAYEEIGQGIKTLAEEG